MEPVRVNLYGLYPTTRGRYLGRQAVVFLSVLGMFLLARAAPTPEEFARDTQVNPPLPATTPATPYLYLALQVVGMMAPPEPAALRTAARVIVEEGPKGVPIFTPDQLRAARGDVNRGEAPSALPYAPIIHLFVVVKWLSGLALLAVLGETAIMLYLFAKRGAEAKAAAPRDSAKQP